MTCQEVGHTQSWAFYLMVIKCLREALLFCYRITMSHFFFICVHIPGRSYNNTFPHRIFKDFWCSSSFFMLLPLPCPPTLPHLSFPVSPFPFCLHYTGILFTFSSNHLGLPTSSLTSMGSQPKCL